MIHDSLPQDTINLKSPAYMGHDLGASFHTEFAIQAQRVAFQAQPPELQRETLERVQRIVREHPNSWLARHWREIYRVGL